MYNTCLYNITVTISNINRLETNQMSTDMGLIQGNDGIHSNKRKENNMAPNDMWIWNTLWSMHYD